MLFKERDSAATLASRHGCSTTLFGAASDAGTIYRAVNVRLISHLTDLSLEII